MAEGANVVAFDPEAMENVRAKYGDKVTFVEDRDQALNNADALVIATEWQVFRNPDFEIMEKEMNQKVIFDGRNLYDTQEMEEQGFYYNSIGRILVRG